MNYASVFLVFILACAAIFWYISGRRYYTGPIIEAHAEDYDSNSGDAAGSYRNEKGAEV
jgi:hypothetical protein